MRGGRSAGIGGGPTARKHLGAPQQAHSLAGMERRWAAGRRLRAGWGGWAAGALPGGSAWARAQHRLGAHPARRTRPAPAAAPPARPLARPPPAATRTHLLARLALCQQQVDCVQALGDFGLLEGQAPLALHHLRLNVLVLLVLPPQLRQHLLRGAAWWGEGAAGARAAAVQRERAGAASGTAGGGWRRRRRRRSGATRGGPPAPCMYALTSSMNAAAGTSSGRLLSGLASSPAPPTAAMAAVCC